MHEGVTTDDAVDPEHGEVAAERARQVGKGYDETIDDRHGAYALARMAQGYVLRGLDQGNRSDFIKAAAALESAAASFRRLGHPLGTGPAALAAAGAGEALRAVLDAHGIEFDGVGSTAGLDNLITDLLAARGDAATPTEVEWGVREPNGSETHYGAGPGEGYSRNIVGLRPDHFTLIQRTVSAWREVQP